MDAANSPLEQEKRRLLGRIAEIEVQQQRRRGLFDKVPHFSEIEDAGQELGRFLSRLTQGRLANEVAVGEQVERECPICGKICPIEVIQRTVTGLDGPTELLEAKAHCPACRRDFFPSA